MSLQAELLAIENEFWPGGPEAYARHCDDKCLVVFAEMTALMTRDDLAKMAEESLWSDVNMQLLGLVRLSETAAVVAYEWRALRKDGKRRHAFVSSG